MEWKFRNFSIHGSKRTFRGVKDPRTAIEPVGGGLVKSRYSRSSTGSNIIKAGTIVDPRIVARDEEDRWISRRAFQRVRVPSSARCSRGGRGVGDRSAATRIRDPGLDRDRGRTCPSGKFEDDSESGSSEGREGNLRWGTGLEGSKFRGTEGPAVERDHGLSGQWMFVNLSSGDNGITLDFRFEKLKLFSLKTKELFVCRCWFHLHHSSIFLLTFALSLFCYI